MLFDWELIKAIVLGKNSQLNMPQLSVQSLTACKIDVVGRVAQQHKFLSLFYMNSMRQTRKSGCDFEFFQAGSTARLRWSIKS